MASTTPHKPIDQALRDFLRTHTKNQVALARRIKRDRTWLNRYLNGTGVAEIDDVIQMLAAFSLDGEAEATLTEVERRLVKAFRALPDDRLRLDAIVSMEAVRKDRRQAPSRESNSPNTHTPAPAIHTRSKKRRAGGT